MTMTERKTLAELRARYELEPTLQDVYVEGRFDQEILFKYFKEKGQSERIVYEIDSVDITADKIVLHGLTEGNKQRVVVLARELAGALSKDCSYRCIVDKDFDHWLGTLETTLRLVWTEFCSIELYFHTDELLSDFILLTAKARIHNWSVFTTSFNAVLRDIYSVRLTAINLNWSMDWLLPDKCMTVQDDDIKFDLSEFVLRLLSKNGKLSSKDEFNVALNKNRGVLSGDPRNSIYGHDFIYLIAWTIRNFSGMREFDSEAAIGRLFILTAGKAASLRNLTSV